MSSLLSLTSVPEQDKEIDDIMEPEDCAITYGGDENVIPDDVDGSNTVLNANDLKYVHETSTAQICVDLFHQAYGSEAMSHLIDVITDDESINFQISLFKLMLENRKNVAEAILSNTNDKGNYVRSLPVKVSPDMLFMKSILNAAQSSMGLLTYSVSSEKFETLESNTTRLEFSQSKVMPTVCVDNGTVKKRISPTSTMASLMGYYLCKTKDGNPVLNSLTYGRLTSNLRLFGKFSFFSWNQVSAIHKVVLEEYKKNNAVDCKLVSIKTFEAPKILNSLNNHFSTQLNDLVKINEDILNLTIEDNIPNVEFNHLRLAEEREFRNHEDLGKMCKDPCDIYSMKINGLAAIKKFLVAVLDFSPMAKQFIGIGHSKTNNWEGMLGKFGCHLITGNICSYNLDCNEHPRKSFEDLPELLPIELHEDGKPESIFDIRESDILEAWKNYKINNDKRIKLNNDEGEDFKGYNVLLDDVYIPIDSHEDIKIAKNSGKKNLDATKRILAHHKKIVEFVNSGWVVIAKFVPKFTTVLGKNRVWDWENYMPNTFNGMYIKVYNDARMHNGEVVLAIAKDQVREDMIKFTPKLFLKLSKLQQYRMMWGNSLRNYLLFFGIPIISNVPSLSKLAIKFATDKMRKSWYLSINAERDSSTIEFQQEHEKAYSETIMEFQIKLEKEEEKKKIIPIVSQPHHISSKVAATASKSCSKNLANIARLKQSLNNKK